MRRLKRCLTGLAVAAVLGQYPVQAQASPSVDASTAFFALEKATSSNPILADFYAARSYRPIWFDEAGPTADAERLIGLLASADLDGLDAKDFSPAELLSLVGAARRKDPSAVARAESRLSRALLKYSNALQRRRDVGITYIDKGLRRYRPPAVAPLEAVAARASLEEILQVHPFYRALRTAYADWRKQWANLPSVRVPEGPVLMQGSKGQRVRLVRERLGLPASGVFDRALATKVSAFRQAHGLSARPVVDARTIALLNASREEQESRIALNLERVRHLPAPAIGRHIVVDAAAQQLWLFDGVRIVDSMKVIVGKPAEPTPMLAALIRYASLNPYWNVPPDLVAKRIAPHVLSDGPSYLRAEGYEILSDWSDAARPIDPSGVDWRAVAAGEKALPVRQLPGPANMMGAMKFMFPNRFGVYLHDTPEKGLFGDADRRRSSGCVRLEDARRVASWLFGKVPEAPDQGGEYHVPLDRPVPVYITYLTAAPAAGGIAFRDDVYDRDRPAVTRLASVH